MEKKTTRAPKGVRILVGSLAYRQKFQIAERRNRAWVLPDDVYEADYDDLGDVAPGMVITVSEDRARVLCDDGLKSNVPERGLPARRYVFCTRMSEADKVRQVLDLVRRENPDLYRRLYPTGH